MNRCLSFSRARVFGLPAEDSAVPKFSPTIIAVFAPRYFSVDLRNENLPKKTYSPKLRVDRRFGAAASSAGHRRGMIANSTEQCQQRSGAGDASRDEYGLNSRVANVELIHNLICELVLIF
jgi:hypothetical protein